MIELTIGGQTKRSKFAPKAVAVDFAALPQASQDFIVRYGLKQYLADGVAGAESQEDFNTGVEERLGKLKSGDLTRTKGDGAKKPDTETGRAQKLAKDAIRAKIKAAGLETTPEQREEIFAKFFADEEKMKPFAAEAKRQLAAEKATGDILEGLI